MADQFRLSHLTPDDRVWRVDWLGEIEYPGAVRQYRQPCIKVALSPLLDFPDSFSQTGSFRTDVDQQRHEWVSLGALFMLRIGDLWQHGQFLKSPLYSAACFDLDISPDTTKFVKAGLAIDGHNLLPFSEHLWHRRYTKSYCLSVKVSEDETLIIPGAELVRFYFGSSSSLLKQLVTGPLQEDRLWQKKTYDGDTYHLHLKLAQGLSGASAADIGRIALDAHAFRSAASVYAHIVQATAERETAYLYAGFPFRGKTTLAVTGMWLSFGDQPKRTFLVFGLRSCSHSFPFASLTYEASDRHINRRNTDGENAERGSTRSAQNRKAKSKAEIDRGDPGARKPPHRLYTDQNIRFPDLQRKSVWRERLVALGVTEVLVKHADGVLEKLAFGESEGSSDIRAIDIARDDPPPKIAEIITEQLPHFVRVGLAMALKQCADRTVKITAKPLLLFGRTEPVFALPMVVDEDGVVDTSLMHTGADGVQRVKRACFVGLFEGEKETKKLAIIEGESHQSSPAVMGVQSTDIVELIAAWTARLPVA